MQTRVAIAVLTGVSLLLAGCLPLRRHVDARYGSLKDDAPHAPRAAQTPVQSPAPRAAALPPPSAPVATPAPAQVPAPAPVAAPIAPIAPPVKPRGTQDITSDDRTREEQLARCAQRHVDYQAGKLNETAEQKQIRDQICAEVHRADHARKDAR